MGLLPRFSAKLSGAAQAPVSLVFLGSGTDLLEVFAAAGWHVADRVTPRTALRAFACGVLNRPYPSAPVLPVFLDGKLHDLAFQRHDEGGSSRCRHHARWWLTDFTCDGKQVWVATASFDAGVGIGRLFPLPIHHIHPDIDAERDYIVGSLTATGRVEVTQDVRVTEPMTGRNAAGDRFFTAGHGSRPSLDSSRTAVAAGTARQGRRRHRATRSTRPLSQSTGLALRFPQFLPSCSTIG